MLHELKRWLYEHRILLPRDRTLRELIVQAIRDVEAACQRRIDTPRFVEVIFPSSSSDGAALAA